MTPEESKLCDQLQEGKDRWMLEADRLAAEVRRLQGLIKQAEWAVVSLCPWCGYMKPGPHHRDCQAFPPVG
jgi:hypothetical protein